MNKVIIIGRLTKDPELRYAAGSGTAVCRFTLAVARQFKKDETDFINCIAFNKAGEAIAQYLTKGRQLAVTGNIRTGSYDAQDNNQVNAGAWNPPEDMGFGEEVQTDYGDMPF